MNLRALPDAHWVLIALDGRVGVALHDDPVVPAMRRLTVAAQEHKQPRPADLAAVAAWLDEREPQQLTLWEAA